MALTCGCKDIGMIKSKFKASVKFKDYCRKTFFAIKSINLRKMFIVIIFPANPLPSPFQTLIYFIFQL